ncbi:MAG TPA: hypothetical protein VNA29_07195 [Sphingomicrobium sp.]|nr:hypothetical protein [Sphingomicrobium sp.]
MRKPRFPETLPAEVAAAFEPRGADATIPDIPFTPVPRQRRRRNGWTEKRQRAFIAALARCGSAAAAARHVGMTKRGAYRLLGAPGADDFARAWDEAADMGRARLECDALERALNGSFVPIYRRGKLARVEHRRNDRLAIALLSGADKDVEDRFYAARNRRSHHSDLTALDAARAERERQVADAEAAYVAEVERLTADLHSRLDARAAAQAPAQPRVRLL